jgi:hypothetical protein
MGFEGVEDDGPLGGLYHDEDEQKQGDSVIMRRRISHGRSKIVFEGLNHGWWRGDTI